MGVPGPKLLDDEKFTQDFLSICTPTFVTPNVVANANLQQWILKGRPLYYFADPHDSHMLDGLMQSLWNKTQTIHWASATGVACPICSVKGRR